MYSYNQSLENSGKMVSKQPFKFKRKFNQMRLLFSRFKIMFGYWKQTRACHISFIQRTLHFQPQCSASFMFIYEGIWLIFLIFLSLWLKSSQISMTKGILNNGYYFSITNYRAKKSENNSNIFSYRRVSAGKVGLMKQSRNEYQHLIALNIKLQTIYMPVPSQLLLSLDKMVLLKTARNTQSQSATYDIKSRFPPDKHNNVKQHVDILKKLKIRMECNTIGKWQPNGGFGSPMTEDRKQMGRSNPPLPNTRRPCKGLQQSTILEWDGFSKLMNLDILVAFLNTFVASP